ncbi:MAG TPA: hypothetical protein VIX12_10160, partial [Candidatus Binataceae bacterium]
MVRRTTTMMTALGVALVVTIVSLLLGFIAGLRGTMLQEGNRDNWIVLSRGVTSEPSSYVSREQYEIITSRAEVATDTSATALV